MSWLPMMPHEPAKPEDKSYRPGSPSWERVENWWATHSKTARAMKGAEGAVETEKQALLEVYDDA